ncbi:HEAT repeat domain-containing protein [Polyangium jinanense]|uniref:HEAT repeat domain-containing protein n=1 Tax=Polyangium jinanense TaxID=2829994 RepID=A0A9X3X626_9BACT|nr:HEAT repeat domain-containing protein [Polyangium jinanense]MDC3960117.1 HEAT repeat domain-containing protein [Polyangium jinanense]MDC3984434.1 HEAT repeat domain-containing protein [Polyangium jinanense]
MSDVPKPKRDVLDPALAARFAWRIAPPPEPSPPQADAPPAPDLDPTASEALAEHAARACEELAKDVRKAWALASPPAQAAATKRLLRFARRIGFEILGMSQHPLEAVRLLRLVARHIEAAPIRTSDMFQLAWLPLPDRHPEMIELIVEAARTGDKNLAFVLDRTVAETELEGRYPGLGARLAEIADTAQSWDVRALAIRWLSLDEFPAAIPTLRRALRTRHARLRYYALFILAQMKGWAEREEDVLWLLEDAVRHPLDGGHGTSGFERIDDYEEALIDVLRGARSPEGWKPLEIILEGGGAHIFRRRPGLDADWALKALAAGYPERAVHRIDRELADSSGLRRYAAISTLALLPEELARPRLIEAAGCSEHDLVERAKTIWFERFGGALPVSPLAGVPVFLLEGPPSERLFACLTVLRGASQEARFVMVDALLAEAPEGSATPEQLSPSQREALALLLFTLRMSGTLYKHPTLGNLGEADWAKLLLRRFGALAFEGLASLAEPPALAGVARGWLDALTSAARKGLLDPAQRERLQGIARAALASPVWDNSPAPLLALSVVGAPEECVEQLWSILTAPEDATDPRNEGSRSNADASRWASIVLRGVAETPGFGARIAAAAAEAFQERRFDLYDRLMYLGSERKAPEVLDVARATLSTYDGDPEAHGSVCRAAHVLVQAKHLEDAWILSALAQPEAPLFKVAASLIRQSSPAPMLEALTRALVSTARSGAAAAEAAKVLVLQEVLAGDDARLAGILERAPDRERAALCGALIDAKVPLASYRHHVAACLLSSDLRVTRELHDPLWLRKPEGMEALFEELLPRVQVEDTRDFICHLLRAPNEAAKYWVDGDEDEEDEEDEDDWDEDDEDDGDEDASS